MVGDGVQEVDSLGKRQGDRTSGGEYGQVGVSGAVPGRW